MTAAGSNIDWTIELPIYQLSSLVDTLAGGAAPTAELTARLPKSLYWLAGDIENATGGNGNDTISGNDANNVLQGGGGNDFITGDSGNDTIDGGTGTDTSMFYGNRSGYFFTKSATGWTVNSTTGGFDTLANIERLQFADKKIAVDLRPTEFAGQALEFIGLLAPNLTSAPSVVGSILSLFDNGLTLHDVCQLALDVGLVRSLAGSSSNAALATMAFRNIIGVNPDGAVLDMLVGYMDGRNAKFSQADFMAALAGMEVNQTHIGLVGLQQTGIEYV